MMKKIQKLRNVLFSTHTGSVTVESIILAPLMFITFIILLYFFFMMLTYVSFNHLSNDIASELNMRQSGYTVAQHVYYNLPRIYTYSVETNSSGSIKEGHYLTSNDIEVTPYTNELLCGTYYALDKYNAKKNSGGANFKKQSLNVPFSEVKHIKVSASKPVKCSDGEKMAGNVITVEITYSCKVFGTNFIQPELKALGYNVIT